MQPRLFGPGPGGPTWVSVAYHACGPPAYGPLVPIQIALTRRADALARGSAGIVNSSTSSSRQGIGTGLGLVCT